jgi:SagB-type dehydrogenase family enzyme
MKSFENYHEFIKVDWAEWKAIESDRKKKLPPAPIQKPYPADSKLIDLVAPDDLKLGNSSLIDIINQRKSRRKYTDKALTLEELSFLLWCTQGINRIDKSKERVHIHRRTVPSGGSLHAFETYMQINRVDGLEPGMYRYLPLEHKLLFMWSEAGMEAKVSDACCGQKFVGNGAVVFIWSTLPYRMDWCYPKVGPKVIALDAGHLCQNLYLASEAIGAGTCGIAAYFQDKIDTLLQLDGEEEFVIYIAPVGKVKQDSA